MAMFATVFFSVSIKDYSDTAGCWGSIFFDAYGILLFFSTLIYYQVPLMDYFDCKDRYYLL